MDDTPPPPPGPRRRFPATATGWLIQSLPRSQLLPHIASLLLTHTPPMPPRTSRPSETLPVCSTLPPRAMQPGRRLPLSQQSNADLALSLAQFVYSGIPAGAEPADRSKTVDDGLLGWLECGGPQMRRPLPTPPPAGECPLQQHEPVVSWVLMPHFENI
jgi:hypothetical protein